MTTQTEAERLADELVSMWDKGYLEREDVEQAAAELRRLVSFNQQLMDEVARLQKREWVGLTAEESVALFERHGHRTGELVGAVEDKLKEKNT